MSSVTQTIPTLTGGLSQQPDELKIPGQVSVATNVIPDVTHGLLKRPDEKYVTEKAYDNPKFVEIFDFHMLVYLEAVNPIYHIDLLTLILEKISEGVQFQKERTFFSHKEIYL